MLQAIHPLEDRLVAIGAQLAKHIAMAKAECQEHFQELKVLKEPLMETEKQLKTVWLEALKFQKHLEPPRNLGPGSPRDEVGPVQQEKNTMMEGSPGADPEIIQEEILHTVRGCLDQKWGQWISCVQRRWTN